MQQNQFNVGDSVERLINTVDGEEVWEEGYTVIDRPKDAYFTDYIYIAKPNSRGFKEYYVGVPPEHLRHAINSKID